MAVVWVFRHFFLKILHRQCSVLSGRTVAVDFLIPFCGFKLEALTCSECRQLTSDLFTPLWVWRSCCCFWALIYSSIIMARWNTMILACLSYSMVIGCFAFWYADILSRLSTWCPPLPLPPQVECTMLMITVIKSRMMVRMCHKRSVKNSWRSRAWIFFIISCSDITHYLLL